MQWINGGLAANVWQTYEIQALTAWKVINSQDAKVKNTIGGADLGTQYKQAMSPSTWVELIKPIETTRRKDGWKYDIIDFLILNSVYTRCTRISFLNKCFILSNNVDDGLLRDEVVGRKREKKMVDGMKMMGTDDNREMVDEDAHDGAVNYGRDGIEGAGNYGEDGINATGDDGD